MTLPAPFDAAAERYDDDPHHRVIAEQLVAGLRRDPRPELVVDVATGTGFAAFAALTALGPQRVVAVDVSPRMVEQAVAKAAAADPDRRIEWRVAPAVPLDLPDGAADVVLCASALHLIGAAAPPEWRRVLRPGGQVAFSVPVAADFRPSPQFRALLPADLPVPADEAGAEHIARAAGLVPVRVETTRPESADRPRRAFLVWADAP